MKIAILFPGQGAQAVGMGKDFYHQFKEAREIYEKSESILGRTLIDIIFNGPEEKLNQTEFTQPAILTVSTAINHVLEQKGFKAKGLAGLSLGEYSALVAAGALQFDETLPLVQKRGVYMQEAVPLGHGKMVAIMGLDNETVDIVCSEASREGFVAPANYNCNGQVVISGTLPGLEKAMDLASMAGAKRITALKVSVPFHCALLQPAELKLARVLEKINLTRQKIPVVFNVTGDFEEKPEQVRANLIKQVSNPILWEQAVRKLISTGIDTFIGVGPGDSLVRLMKRIAPELKAYSVETAEDLKDLLKIFK